MNEQQIKNITRHCVEFEKKNKLLYKEIIEQIIEDSENIMNDRTENKMLDEQELLYYQGRIDGMQEVLKLFKDIKQW